MSNEVNLKRAENSDDILISEKTLKELFHKYEKLKAQLEKAEAALLLISAPHCDYRTFESETLERLIECIVADTDCAREYFKEKGQV